MTRDQALYHDANLFVLQEFDHYYFSDEKKEIRFTFRYRKYKLTIENGIMYLSKVYLQPVSTRIKVPVLCRKAFINCIVKHEKDLLDPVGKEVIV